MAKNQGPIKYFIIYRITNLINNKIYVGAHLARDINDDYMGSSKNLKQDIKDLGIENFKKEILFVFDNYEEMRDKEKEIVNRDFIRRDDTYNKTVACGNPGFYYYNNNRDEEYYRLRKENGQKCKKNLKPSTKKGEECYFYGKQMPNNFAINKEAQRRAWELSMSEEAREKRINTLASINHQQGSKNSQYGTRWIHSLEEKRSMRIKKDEPTPPGWINGRKIKFDK